MRVINVFTANMVGLLYRLSLAHRPPLARLAGFGNENLGKID